MIHFNKNFFLIVIPFIKNSELKTFRNNYSQIKGKVNDFHFDHSINKRAIFYNNLTNWTSPILFHVDSSLSYYRHIISSVVRGLSLVSCLKFEESRTSIEGRIGIVFKYHHSSCFSTVGRDPSVKNSLVYFTYNCAENYGYIIHELLHVLGLRHEHTRFDRDHFITINDDNVRDNEEVKKNIHEKDQNDSVITHEDIPYDYGSILHYPRYAFIKWPGYETDGRYN
uniref:Metalloendopeptidase n=1 Tax=Parastrongyloides trichosuri TaxID=131310 RepID=A0A0N4ZD83_PARTI